MKYILVLLIAFCASPAWAQCNKHSLHLDSTAYVLINDDSTLNGDHLTVSMYFRTPSTAIQALFTKNTESNAGNFEYGGSINHTYFNPLATYAITTAHNGNCQVGQGYSIIAPRMGTVPVNTWQHLVFTYDGVSQRIFLNGNIVDSQVTNKGPIQYCPGGQLLLGMNYSGAPAFFMGEMDEVSIYNRALSAGELQSKRNEVLSPSAESGLVGYYRFEEGVGRVVADLSGNGNDGAIIGPHYWTYEVPFRRDFDSHLNVTGSQSVCAGQNLPMFAANTGYVSAEWYRNDSFISDQPAIHPDLPGTYFAVLTDTTGCVKNSDTTVISVKPVPKNPIIRGPATFTNNVLQASYSIDRPAWAFFAQWSAEGSSSVTSTSDTSVDVLWDSSGTWRLSVTITDSTGCRNSDTLVPVNITTTGNPVEWNRPQWSVFPNPASSILNTITNVPVKEDTYIVLRDLTGRVVRSTTISRGIISAELNTEGLSAGIYFLQAHELHMRVVIGR
jgi:hypothetical protein